jgi:serine/threonine protein kinase
MPSLQELLADGGLEIVERDIGGGGSATVHKCRVVESKNRLPAVGQWVAAKEYKRDILKVPQQLARIQQEADVGMRLQHPSLVRTFGYLGNASSESRNDSPVVLLLEWIEGDTLDAWYAGLQKPASWKLIRGVVRDLVAALAELHKNGIFHRDIKPENVMVRLGTSSSVLMDVGVSELTGNDDSTLHTLVKDFVGSARYASPQFILGTTPFSSADDVYGLGATIFLLFTGAPIYSEIERKSVIPIAVVNNQPSLKGLVDGIPAPMKVLLQGMLHRDPKRRPTLAEIAECLEGPDTAPYLTKELSRQSNDVRSYVVLEVDQGSFFADLAGDTPKLGETYTVVRPLKRQLVVPSYSREVSPEMWVAEATLKHMHQNVGHFAIHRSRWRDAPSSYTSFSIPTGQWVHEEGTQLQVVAGDLVLRKT